MTSKRPVGRFRQVVELPARNYRDPRFDNLSGKFNEGIFKNSYSFLEKYEKSEIDDMRKQIKKEKNPDIKRQLERQLQSKVFISL